MARSEDIGDLTLMDEDRGLTRPDNELCAVFDLISISRKAPDQSVLAVVDPFDDIDQFCSQFVKECQFSLPLSLSE